jgi:hypothetical protein
MFRIERDRRRSFFYRLSLEMSPSNLGMTIHDGMLYPGDILVCSKMMQGRCKQNEIQYC